jgi:hypothetical protein
MCLQNQYCSLIFFNIKSININKLICSLNGDNILHRIDLWAYLLWFQTVRNFYLSYSTKKKMIFSELNYMKNSKSFDKNSFKDSKAQRKLCIPSNIFTLTFCFVPLNFKFLWFYFIQKRWNNIFVCQFRMNNADCEKPHSLAGKKRRTY